MITMTDYAAKEIIKRTQLGEGAIGVRLSIKETGCSGNSYQMEHVFKEDSGDDKFEHNGAVLFVPKTQTWMLIGMEMDYRVDKLEEGFVYNNPNAENACGCGESFTIKPSS
jgi:iron-sulfur cluster assembly accessory protein